MSKWSTSPWMIDLQAFRECLISQYLHQYGGTHFDLKLTEITGISYGQKSYIYIWSRRVLPDFGGAPTGLLTGLLRLSRTALLFQRIHQNVSLLHISGLSPVSCYMLRFITVDMTIHFLHMEPSNPPTYYTDLYIDIS